MSEHSYFVKHGVEQRDDKQKAKLQSCTEQNPLNEFLYQANLAPEEYEGQMHKEIKIKEQKVIFKQKKVFSGVTDEEKRKQLLEKVKFVKIPKRPIWKDLKKEEIETKENQIFLDWRFELQKLEDNFPQAVLTPYEKNLDVWRQLWRTIERSDVLIQIVDCRDPFFYRSEDLEEYVKELDKQVFIILNKADLLPDRVRTLLSEELDSLGMKHIFFSAKDEQKKIDEDQQQEEVKEEVKLNSIQIINKPQLLQIFEKFKIDFGKSESRKDKTELVTIGMVGYPNVGKSSLINVLCGKKMVGVDMKPGKTKNFQTIYLTKEVLLCDCPGLVFPSLVHSKPQMICNGVVSLNTIVNYIEPIKYLIFKSHYEMILRKYKLPLPTNKVTAETSEEEIEKLARDLLQYFSATKGFITEGSGIPDEQKAAKMILQDYINGDIFHFYISPKYLEFKDEIFNDFISKNFPTWDQVPIKNTKKEDLNLVQRNQQDFFNQENLNRELLKEKEKEFFESTGEEELIQLLEGKKVLGYKLDKGQRREMKFMIMRQVSEEELRKKLGEFLFNSKKIFK